MLGRIFARINYNCTVASVSSRGRTCVISTRPSERDLAIALALNAGCIKERRWR